MDADADATGKTPRGTGQATTQETTEAEVVAWHPVARRRQDGRAGQAIARRGAEN